MKVLRWIWNWSVLVTVPVTVAFGYWAIETWRHYRSFGLDYDARPVEVSLRRAGVDVFDHLMRGLRLEIVPADPTDVPPTERLRTLQLFVQESNLARLNSNLPHSGFDFVRGHLWYDGGPQRVRIRYRGDFLGHWGHPKKSLRVRTRRNVLFEGMREFNLIAPKYPEQLNNYLGYRLAHLLGLVAPRVELVNLTLNGKRTGFRVLTEQLDEGTLRHHDRMPGDLYAGEMIAKDWWRGISNHVFDHVPLWKKIAVNNHYDLESRAPLEELVRLINEPMNEPRQRRLSALLDMEQWGRFAAFELLTQTDHYDRHHNWRLFYDPWKTRFEPVVWDPIGWMYAWRPKDPTKRVDLDRIVSRLHVWLHENSDFLLARQRAFQGFFGSGQHKQFLAEADAAFASLRHAARFDPDLRPADESSVDRRMRNMRGFIARTFNDLEQEFLESPTRLDYAVVGSEPWHVRFQVTGRRPVDAVELRFVRPVNGVETAAFRHLTPDGPKEYDVSARLAGQGNVLRLEVPMLVQRRHVFEFNGLPLRNHKTNARPTSYELRLPGLSADNRLLEIVAFRNGHPEAAEKRVELPMHPIRGLYVLMDEREPGVDVWSGEVLVEGVREIRDDVLLEAGTTVRLAPGAALLFRGRLVAEGTEEEPVRFVSACRDQEPWGVVALKGRGADGSRLSHCRFEAGSGIMHPLAEYSAMLSVHEVQDVTVDDCTFRNNKIVDDMVHAVYSEIAFTDCTFENALFDAVDLDISIGSFVRCRFVDSGNDQVDLMTARCTVVDCTFVRGGDKGISVGEGSTLLAVDNVFRDCNIGVQAKDGSVAVVANADFDSNNLAMDAYKKNWRYDAGGDLTVLKSRLTDNTRSIACDRYSHITLMDSYLDGEVDEPPDQVELDLVDAGDRQRARSASPLRFPSRLGIEARGRSAWARLRPAIRGASIGESQER